MTERSVVVASAQPRTTVEDNFSTLVAPSKMRVIIVVFPSHRGSTIAITTFDNLLRPGHIFGRYFLPNFQRWSPIYYDSTYII
uniref:Putative ovule protein n=1 Tax=Solanum chacoense TaxID=4108 RepID=A0A0V0IX47_SOLCH